MNSPKIMKKKSSWVGKFVFLICIFMIMTGCVPLLMHESRLNDNNSSYNIFKSSLPALDQEMTRLFVYLIDGGPSASWALGVGPQMDGWCTIDDAVFSYHGASYFYVELPAGSHTFTAEKVGGPFTGFRRGQKIVEINLKKLEEGYVRIDLNGVGVFTSATPVYVDRKTAEEEMAQLRMAKDYKTTYTVSK